MPMYTNILQRPLYVDHINYYPYSIPFCAPFTTPHGTLNERQGAIISITTDNNITGIGELAPLSIFGGADLNTAMNALQSLLHDFFQQHRPKLQELLYLSDQKFHAGELPSPVLFALETALLDIQGQSEGESLHSLLTSQTSAGKAFLPFERRKIPVNAVIGAACLERAIELAQQACSEGYRCLKLKMIGTSSQQIERVAVIRAAIGSSIDLRLDANEGWNFEQARSILNCCEQFNIQYVEQPLPAHDLAGMQALRQETSIPIAADEAIADAASARAVLQEQAADLLVLKPQLTGGLRNTRRIIQEAADQGVQCVITSTLEAGIGVTAALHLAAAAPELTLPCGLATLDLLASNLLLTPLPIRHGEMRVPTGPGLGIQLDYTALTTQFSYGDLS